MDVISRQKTKTKTPQSKKGFFFRAHYNLALKDTYISYRYQLVEENPMHNA